MPTPIPRLSSALVLAAAVSTAAVAQPTSYQLTEIAPPPGQLVECFDLNDAGFVVGKIYPVGSRDSQAFVWQAGALAVLPSPAGFAAVLATHIDAAGRVYGQARATATSIQWHPVLWLGGQPMPVPTAYQNVSEILLPSRRGTFVLTNVTPFDIPTSGWKNEFGWVDEPDFTLTSGDAKVPLVHDMVALTITTVGSFDGADRLELTAVNDRGQAVGFVAAGGFNHRTAVRWDPVQGVVALGTGGRRASLATAISDSGVVVGFVERTASGDVNTDVRLRPFVWRAGVFEELPVLPGFEHGTANDTNGNAVVGSLGKSATNRFQTDGAWIRHGGGAVLDLDGLTPTSPGWRLTDARRINAGGQVLVADHSGPGFLDARWAVLTPQ